MKYFSVKELTYSSTASRQGIDNTPSKRVASHIEELINTILDPLREAWGDAIIVTSGYRCPELNKAVGGVSSSAHQTGYAADLYPSNRKFDEFKKFVKKFLEDYSFDQYIEEMANGRKWVHIGLKPQRGLPRRMFLKFDGKKYVNIK